MRNFISKNPFTGTLRQIISPISSDLLEKKMLRSAQAYFLNQQRTYKSRSNIVKIFAEIIAKNTKDISQLITFETGKPIIEAQNQVQKAIEECKYYSQRTQFFVKPTHIKTSGKKTLIKYLPLGSIYCINSFSNPFYSNLREAIPNLLLGNCILARSSDSTPLTGKLIEDLFIQAGFDSGQYLNIYTTHDQLQQIVTNTNIIGVTFTGSTSNGKIVAAQAGKYLKKTVLQLSSNDPFIVLDDANIDLAVFSAVKAKCLNSGLNCFSPKRFIISDKIYDEFTAKLIESVKMIKFGDPLDRSTQMGPLAREDLYERLETQMKKIKSNYKILFEESKMKRPFFPLTVMQHITNSQQNAAQQQLFGPILKLYRARDEAQAIKIANSSVYGLGGCVFSEGRGQIVLNQINCGMGFVNAIPTLQSTYPCGGIGQSGYGRSGWFQSFRQFANIKTQYVSKT